MMYAELALVLGDIHLPHRAASIPGVFKKMLVPGKTQHVLCTGNLCTQEQFDFIQKLAPSVHIVRGDMDEITDFPDETVVKIGEFKIGLCHGHQIIPWGDSESLSICARQLDVDILITGHTHELGTMEIEGRWIVNPGSITGSYSTFKNDINPSFMCLSINGNKAVAYVYEITAGEVKISQSKYTKHVQ